MKVVDSIENIPPCISPIALTIGMFDGIHLGHQSIIKKLHQLTRKTGTRVLLTFSNHPSEVLRAHDPVPLIMTLEHKLYLLKKYGMDLVIALPFTREFSEQSYLDFLRPLHAKLPFSDLVLGTGAAFGKNREGDATHLQAFEKEMGFKAHYLKKESHHKETISSGVVRQLIVERKLKKIKKRLGRPYTLWHPTTLFRQENESLYSWTFEEPKLCMLPSGVYGIDLDSLSGIAFIRGHRVTLYVEKEPPPPGPTTIAFSEYLHSELDPTLFQSKPASILEDLSAQPSCS